MAIDLARKRMKPTLVEYFERWQEEFRLNYKPGPLNEYLKEYHGYRISNAKTRKPRTGDWVEYWGETGFIARLTTDHVIVRFGNKWEEMDRSMFILCYDTPRGRTVWQF